MWQEVLERERTGGGLHHAYILRTDEILWPALSGWLSKVVGEPVRNHPDICYREFSRFGIDDGRWLKEAERSGPIRAERRFFVLKVGLIDSLAQNSLLKIFEEPSSFRNHFFILAPRALSFLPTLLSRCRLIDCGTAGEKTDLLRLGVEERLARLKEILDIDDLELARARAGEMLSELERSLAPVLSLGWGPEQKALARFARRLYVARRLLAEQTSLPHLVLESLLLGAPPL